MPAMVALVEQVDYGIVGVHRTYITPDHRRLDRATLGLVSSGAVRLGKPKPREWLAVGEGIETTLAVMIACAMPGWAALSANGIRGLVLPEEATHVVIVADHDTSGVGGRAAEVAAERWLAEGRRVRIAMPSESDTDMADLLVSTALTEACHVA
jgi:putative DNA primase/helicase